MFGPHKQGLLECTGSRGAWCKIELDENRHGGLATCQLSTWQGSMILKTIAERFVLFLDRYADLQENACYESPPKPRTLTMPIVQAGHQMPHIATEVYIPQTFHPKLASVKMWPTATPYACAAL